MEKISGISNTQQPKNDLKRKSSYNTAKTAGKTSVDALEYKRALDTALEGKKAVRNEDKFKSLIEKAGEKLTSGLTVAPVKEDSYKRESTIMMANSGLAAKSRVEKKPIEELSSITTKKKTITSYSTSYGEYKRELGYVTPSYKSFEDTSKESRGYKNNYSTHAKTKKATDFDEIKDNTSLLKPKEKISFWSKFKNAIKNFFKTEEKSQEPATVASVQPEGNKAAQYRQSVQKAAPQISGDAVRKRAQEELRKEIREMYGR